MSLLCFLRLMVGSLAVFFSTSVFATAVSVVEVPTYWRVENYVGSSSSVTVWYATASAGFGTKFPGTNCPNVVISDAASATKIFALIVSAKLTAHKIFMFLDDTTCAVSSFGMDS